MVQNYNFFVKPQSKNQPFSIFFLKTADFYLNILTYRNRLKRLAQSSRISVRHLRCVFAPCHLSS